MVAQFFLLLLMFYVFSPYLCLSSIGISMIFTLCQNATRLYTPTLLYHLFLVTHPVTEGYLDELGWVP